MEAFSGYHSEWNLGSPGGWDYQRMTQEIGRACWEKIRARSGLELDLDFTHPLLNPMPGFLAMILRAHRLRHGSRPAFVLVVAEEETLESVVENRNLALALNAMEGVRSEICAPQEVEFSGGQVLYRGEEVTTLFMDFNTDVLLRLHRQQDLTGLIEAVRRGILVNPRGMESINSKAIFEAVMGPLSGRLSRTTVERTPWTRAFYPRRTEAPDGSAVSDLVEWTRARQQSLVLKPAHGYSGHGVFVGPLREDREQVVRRFRPFSCHRVAGGMAVTRERERNNTLARVRETVLAGSGRVVRERAYCERLFTERDLASLLAAGGFSRFELYRDFSGHQGTGDCGFMNSRVIVTARP